MDVQRNTDGDTPSSTISLLPKFEISSLSPSSEVVLLVSDLVGNPEDRISRDVAQSYLIFVFDFAAGIWYCTFQVTRVVIATVKVGIVVPILVPVHTAAVKLLKTT